jgi:hypothetical protein
MSWENFQWKNIKETYMPIKWEPAIYEHKAALIGKSPAEVANSADLLTEALLKEYKDVPLHAGRQCHAPA